MIDVSSLPSMLQLHPVGEHVYAGEPEHEGENRNVVFGGQILAQMIVSAHLDRNADRDDVKEVKSIHAIFARAGDYTQPIQYEVERMHDGRTLGSDTVTFSQNGKIMSRGLILAATDVEPLIIGKPEPTMLNAALAAMGADPARTAVLGDRLETDILGGQNAGLRTILVLTGISDEAALDVSPIKPDWVFQNIQELTHVWDGIPL